MVKLGGVTLPHGLMLGPMAGFTDSPFRLLARRCGADYTVSEMISARALAYRDGKTGLLAAADPEEAPLGLQLFGNDPAVMAEAARILLSGEVPGCPSFVMPAAIDVNMGCPMPKIVKNGDGSALARDIPRAAAVIRALKDVCAPLGVAVTVKFRAGWDERQINAPELSRALADAGADLMVIHARTREQMYTPGIDLAVIEAVRTAVPSEIPVIGNGDVRSAEDALAMMDKTGCDGVMIGRAALGNPWLFREIACRMDGRGGDFTPPTRLDRIEAALWLMRAVIALRGGNEALGVRDCRGRVAHFITGMRGSAAIRDRINRAVTYREAEEALRSAEEK